MSKRLTVVVSQGQSHNPAKRKLEEDIVAHLLGERLVEVTIIPHLYDLTADGTGMLCLNGISGDLLVLSWMYPRAAHWILNRNSIRGHERATLLVQDTDSDDEDKDKDDDEQETAEDKSRVIETLEIPDRNIYCIDLRASNNPADYLNEIQRIARECATQTVPLTGWIGGEPKPDQLNRFLNPAEGNVDHQAGGNGNGNGNGNGRAPAAAEGGAADGAAMVAEPLVVQESTDRRWYPVIDFGRCTNCMECIDFCLFGVYGVDAVDTILVEQPDNCRKGCPACSRVCPENAIIFPQHKTPAIAGSPEIAGSLKIDLSKLFGVPDIEGVDIAVRERDEQLLLAGRDMVGHDIGLPRRHEGQEAADKDELDDLIDQLDDMDL